MAEENPTERLAREKAELEVQKLREEVAKSRRENRFWIIGLLISIFGFGLGNLSTLERVVIREPRVKLVVEDSFVQRVGQLRIADLAAGGGVAIDAPVNAAAEGWITLAPGSYLLEVAVEGEVFFSEKLLLRSGDSEPVIVPTRETGNIRIVTRNHTPSPKPGTVLDLSIEASGNGFLWVFDLESKGHVALVYPDASSRTPLAEIRAGEVYRIPDDEGTAILANDSPGREHLLFVVTSSSSPSDAQKIATRMSGAVVAKARTGSGEANWGAQDLEYDVRL